MSRRALVFSALFLGLCYLISVCAWQSDDAYITFRTVQNAWRGDGLTWNPGERVQAYTHPLWMMICAVCYGLSHEVYYSTLIVSIMLALSAAVLIVRTVAAPWIAALALFFLANSGSFVDYATSGLENPLLYLLLVLFIRLARSEVTANRLRLTSLLASAIGLTRLDALLLVLPATLGRWWHSRQRIAALGPLLTGLLPLIGWALFTLIYYGSPVPNPAWAKLNVDIPVSALFGQGLLYFQDSLMRDPVTLTVILLSIGLVFHRTAAGHRLIILGIALYLAFVLRIGGDFMSGRFFAAPFVAAVAVCAAIANDCCSQWRPVRWLAPALIGGLCILGLAWPGSRWTSGIGYGVGQTYRDIVRPTGIADERAYYYPSTGLIRLLIHRSNLWQPSQPFPPYPGALMGARFAQSDQTVAVWDEAGLFGYFSGNKTVIEVWGLADPLLARIPYQPAESWRIGHYPRQLPEGYLETRREGRNLLQDAELAALYDGLVLVTRGKVFTRARWREIWRFNSGYYVPVLRKHAVPLSSS